MIANVFGKKSRKYYHAGFFMHAIELPVEIDANQQIHVQLPKSVQANKARIIVIYDEPVQGHQQSLAEALAHAASAAIDFEPTPLNMGLKRVNFQPF